MANNKNLKAFVRYDGSGRVVSGSLILRLNKPKVGRWEQVKTYECCGPVVPPIVTALVVGTVTATTIAVTWAPATVAQGETPVTHYIIYKNGVQVAIVSAFDTLAYTYSGLTTLTSYALSYAAVAGTSTVTSSVTNQVTA